MSVNERVTESGVTHFTGGRWGWGPALPLGCGAERLFPFWTMGGREGME